MNGIATITQRGQVVIPQPIRKLFKLRTADRVLFETAGDKIIVKPLLSLDEAFGMIRAVKKVSKKEYKQVIAKRVAKRFKK